MTAWPRLALLAVLAMCSIATASPPCARAAGDGRCYYVAPSGSDSNLGTEGHPWRTIDKAASVAVPGDTIYVSAGTYKEHVRFRTSGMERTPVTQVVLSKGSRATFGCRLSSVDAGDYLYVYRSQRSNNGAYEITQVGDDWVAVEGRPFADEDGGVLGCIATPVIFRVYPGETVTVNPDGETLALEFGVWGQPGSGVDYVIVEGIDVTRSDGAGVQMCYSSHNVVRDAEVYANDAPGVGLWLQSQYNIVENCEIYDNGWDQPGEGVYIGSADGDMDCDYNHVLHCHIHHPRGGNEGTDVKPWVLHTVIEGNLYTQCTSTWGVIVLGQDSGYSLAYGNTIRDSSGSPQWAGCITIAGHDNLVCDNLIWDSKGLDAIYLEGERGNKVLDNVIVNVDVGIGMEGDNSGSQIQGNVCLDPRLAVAFLRLRSAFRAFVGVRGVPNW